MSLSSPLREIANPKDVITAPVDTMGTVKDFCSQTCLSSFNFKRNSAVSTLSSLSTMTVAVKCSMCKKACIVRDLSSLSVSVWSLLAVTKLAIKKW